MALATPSPRSVPALRDEDRQRPATVPAPPDGRPDLPVAPAGEGTRRERVRMDLLVARARTARP